MTTEETPIRYAIVEYVTQKNILNVYDSIAIDRLLFELVQYDPKAQRQIARAQCYVPVRISKLLVHQALAGQTRDGWKLEVFGGSSRDGEIESRTFRVEYDTAQGRFADNPYRITIAVGKGVKTKTGGIAPDGEPHTRVQMRFPLNDFLMHCLEIRDYLGAHQHEIEDVRRLEQVKRYETRVRAKPQDKLR